MNGELAERTSGIRQDELSLRCCLVNLAMQLCCVFSSLRGVIALIITMIKIDSRTCTRQLSTWNPTEADNAGPAEQRA